MKLKLSNLTDQQVKDQYGRVESLFYESFGNDHEAYDDLVDEKWQLFRELKRRGIVDACGRWLNVRCPKCDAPFGGHKVPRHTCTDYEPMTWDELRQLRKEGVII